MIFQTEINRVLLLILVISIKACIASDSDENSSEDSTVIESESVSNSNVNLKELLKSIFIDFQKLEKRLDDAINQIDVQNCPTPNTKSLDNCKPTTSEEIETTTQQITTTTTETPADPLHFRLIGSPENILTFTGIPTEEKETLETIEMNYTKVNPVNFVESIKKSKGLTSIKLDNVEFTEEFDGQRQVRLENLTEYFISTRVYYRGSVENAFPFTKKYKWDINAEFKTRGYSKFLINRETGEIDVTTDSIINEVLANLGPTFVLKKISIHRSEKKIPINVAYIPTTITNLTVNTGIFENGNLSDVIQKNTMLEYVELYIYTYEEPIIILPISIFQGKPLKSIKITYDGVQITYVPNVTVPSLKVLYLRNSGTEILDNEIARNINVIFPNLEVAFVYSFNKDSQRNLLESLFKLDSLQKLYAIRYGLPQGINSTAPNINKALKYCEDTSRKEFWCKIEKDPEFEGNWIGTKIGRDEADVEASNIL